MSETQNSRIVPDVYPTLRYRDAPAAIDWLESAFGFKRVVVYPTDDGGVAHAELAFGNGAIMLGSMKDGAGQTQTTSDQRLEVIYLRVDDVEAHYNRATAQGAEIVRISNQLNTIPPGPILSAIRKAIRGVLAATALS